MKAGKDTNKSDKEVELSGKVVVKKFGEGSKSEHEAVYLETATESYVLRKIGSNPFHDTSLHKLKGKNITARGTINNYIFLAKEVTPERE
jgi:hypothetical protein